MSKTYSGCQVEDRLEGAQKGTRGPGGGSPPCSSECGWPGLGVSKCEQVVVSVFVLFTSEIQGEQLEGHFPNGLNPGLSYPIFHLP